MKALVGLSVALAFGSALFGQRAGGFSAAQPRITGGFGSVVFPGGTPVNTPGIQRSFGNAVFPGGGGPRLVVPNTLNPNFRPNRGGRFGNSTGLVYAYPVYVGGYDTGYYAPDSVPPPQQSPYASPQQAPNVIVIYPSQSAPVMSPSGSGEAMPPDQSGFRMYQTPPSQSKADSAAAESEDIAPHYLLAFKDHVIYSALAYWVDGDTIHYFTAGNKHNQASLGLLDRALTERLNKDTGFEVKLPPAK